MDISIALAQIIGPLLMLVAIGFLYNQDHYAKMVEHFLKNAELYYFSGVMALLVGLFIVINHNIWIADWRVIITVIGWLSVLKGVIRIVFPTYGAKYANAFTDSSLSLNIGAVIILIFGAILCFQGFTWSA